MWVGGGGGEEIHRISPHCYPPAWDYEVEGVGWMWSGVGSGGGGVGGGGR